MIRRVAIAVNMIAAGWWAWTALQVLRGLWTGSLVLHWGALVWGVTIVPPALALIALLRNDNLGNGEHKA
jgi:hypothetical protein